MLELMELSTAKTAFSWPGKVVQARKVQFLTTSFYVFTDKNVRVISEILHIKENFYSQKFTCTAALKETFYISSLNPSFYHLNILNVYSIISTSLGHFFTAPEDLL